MYQKTRLLYLCIAFATLFPLKASAEIFKCKDINGKTTYQEQPCLAGKSSIIKRAPPVNDFDRQQAEQRLIAIKENEKARKKLIAENEEKERKLKLEHETKEKLELERQQAIRIENEKLNLMRQQAQSANDAAIAANEAAGIARRNLEETRALRRSQTNLEIQQDAMAAQQRRNAIINSPSVIPPTIRCRPDYLGGYNCQ